MLSGLSIATGCSSHPFHHRSGAPTGPWTCSHPFERRRHHTRTDEHATADAIQLAQRAAVVDGLPERAGQQGIGRIDRKSRVLPISVLDTEDLIR